MKVKYLLIILLSSIICKGQTNSISSILNDDNYIIKDSLSAIINSSKFSIYEIIHVENRTNRFLMLKFNNKEFCNKKSLLNTEDYQGYSTDYIRKTNDGFVFSIEFGSRYYYNFKFYFNLYKGNFYLNKVFKTSFDKYSNSKKSKSNLKLIKPAIRFDVFNIHNYTDDI